jgi:hypothetical protein
MMGVMLTQSLSCFPLGIPISSNVLGPCFFGGPDVAVDVADGAAEIGLEPDPCEDIVCCGGRCDARLEFCGCTESYLSGRC